MTKKEKRLEELQTAWMFFVEEEIGTDAYLHPHKYDIANWWLEHIQETEQDSYERGEQNIVKKLNEFGYPCMLLNGELHIVSHSPLDKPLTGNKE